MSAAETGEPLQKKLRLADPDLRIVLRYTPLVESECDESNDEELGSEEEDDDDDDDGYSSVGFVVALDGGEQESDAEGERPNQEEEGEPGESPEEGEESAEKEYQMYSILLAKHSKFVDTTLSVDMKEKHTKTIILHDVTPKTFEKALLYVEDPIAATEAKPSDIMQVLEFYHMYEFTYGLSFAAKILRDYFREEEESNAAPEDLQFLIDAACLVHRLQLRGTRSASAECINAIMKPSWRKRGFGPTIFTQEMIQQLQPLFLSGKVELPKSVEVSQEELKSPLFPKFFVKCVTPLASCHLSGLSLYYLSKFGRSSDVSHRKRSKLDRNAFRWEFPACNEPNDWHLLEGRLILERINRGENSHHEGLRAEQKHGDWAIFIYPVHEKDEPDYEIYPVYWSPYSAHLEFPPVSHWQDTDCLEVGILGKKLRIVYHFKPGQG